MKFIFSVLLLWVSIFVSAQKIKYEVFFPNLVHHEANISLIASGIAKQTAVFRMSRSSPGRYATHEFGKNVYDIKAFDENGKSISITRIDGDVYEVAKHNGYVKVEYTLYGNYADGTYVGLDETSIHFNMPAAFMWVKGYDKTPIEIQFNVPKEKKWTIATQLKPTNNPNSFESPSGLQYFMDCPTKIGSLLWSDWKISNPNKTYQFHLALEANTNQLGVDTFAQKVKFITQQAQNIFGETPAYDFGSYTFLASINPYVKGDGMEHRNSTMITSGRVFTGANNHLGVFAHEFFHCWNVERIRPKTIEPFNFEKSNMSNELWMAEGFTQYYGNLIMKRCSFMEMNDWYATIASFINTKENTPGGIRFSPAENSRNAVFVDAGVAVDVTNYQNMFASYYPYGAAIALALDLTLRSKYNTTLDNYMQQVWKKFGKTEIAYNINDLEITLAEFTKDAAFAKSFFAKYVTGHESFDYNAVLAFAGLQLQKVQPNVAWVGRVQFTETNGLKVNSSTIWQTPLYNAGIDIDDVIISVDGNKVATQIEFNKIIASHKVGDEISVEFKHRDETKTSTLKLAENPNFKVVGYEELGLEVTQPIKVFRANWLNNKVKE
jgi:predicted metalloprotease with PDZ domain